MIINDTIRNAKKINQRFGSVESKINSNAEPDSKAIMKAFFLGAPNSTIHSRVFSQDNKI